MNRFFLFFENNIDIELMSKFEMKIEDEYYLDLSYEDTMRILTFLVSESYRDIKLKKMVVVNVDLDASKTNNKNNKVIELDNIIEELGCIANDIINKNKAIEALFDFSKVSSEKLITALVGTNGWKNLEEYFAALKNAQIEYLVLRKYEELPIGFIENDKDLDVLCFNHDEFVAFSCAKKRSIGISGYKILVDNEWIALDVRFVGDCYFDVCWARDMLVKRTLYKNLVYIMDTENYLFSVLYHTLTQKKYISDYYYKFILEQKKELGYSDSGGKLDYNLINDLKEYMYNNRYEYVKPLDNSVVQNQKNIIALQTIKYYPSQQKLWWISFATKLRKCPSKLYDKINLMR